MGEKIMPTKSFQKGDLVRFQLGFRTVQGQVKEDRGPIGIKGRHLYLVVFPAEPPAPCQVELPAESLVLVEEPTASP